MRSCFQYIATGLVWVVFALPGFGEPESYIDAVLKDQPVVYWRFEDKSSDHGRTVTSSAGAYGDHAAYKKKVKLVPGILGQAAQFNGKDAYIDAPVRKPIQLNTLSIEFWFQTKQACTGNKFPGSANLLSIATWGPGSSDYCVILGSSQGNKDQGQFFVCTGPRDTKRDWYLFTPDDYPLNDGHWHHVVITREMAGQKHIYLDGELAASEKDAGGIIHNDARTLQIGGEENHEGGKFLDGLMDEIAIYRYALTADQVANHYNLIKPLLPPRPARVVKAIESKPEEPKADLNKIPPAVGRQVGFAKDVHPILKLMGFNHETLSYFHDSRDMRLTDVFGHHDIADRLT